MDKCVQQPKYLSLLIVLLVLLCSFSFPVLAKKILVIESYHSGYEWTVGYKKALRDALEPEHELVFFEMDTKRIKKSRISTKAELAWLTYKEQMPDLVILTDDNALKYLGHRFASTQTPVVYLGINNNPRNYIPQGSKNITGVLERPLIKRSIMSITEIIPSTKKILVLFDSGITAHTLIESAFDNKTVTKISHVNVDVKLIESYALWKKEIQQASSNGYDAIIVGLYHTLIDGHGLHVSDIDVINWTSKRSDVPIFALWDFAVGKDKTVGGLVLQSYEQGSAAATLVKQIFTGRPPHLLRPITAVNGKYVFSQSALERYNLNLPVKIAHFTDWIE